MEQPLFNPNNLNPDGNVNLLITADGSHTLFNHALNESYHSKHGALQESGYVYIEQGLIPLVRLGKSEIKVLEIGFGTGLNVWLTALKAKEENLSVVMESLEPFPLPNELINELNYPFLLTGKGLSEWQKICQSEWNESQKISGYFSFVLHKTRLEDFESVPEAFDLIYFDAFGPRHQPDVWGFENLSKCWTFLKPGGILVTYCSQGAFRRNLIAAGFEVEKLKGPPGKAEMVRARKV